MSLQIDPDGHKIVQVNVYSDYHFLRFIAPKIVMDGPGDVVFASEGNPWKGSVLTLQQSRAGMNLYSKQGFVQFLTDLDVARGIWFGQLLKREFETEEAMFRSFAVSRVTGYLPKAEVEEDDMVTDLLLLPVVERLDAAAAWEPGRLLYRTLSVIRAFSDRTTFSTYKSMKYRDKLLALASAHLPYKAKLQIFEIDPENLSDSAFQLVLLFS